MWFSSMGMTNVSRNEFLCWCDAEKTDEDKNANVFYVYKNSKATDDEYGTMNCACTFPLVALFSYTLSIFVSIKSSKGFLLYDKFVSFCRKLFLFSIIFVEQYSFIIHATHSNHIHNEDVLKNVQFTKSILIGVLNY